ncbi:uncharacterized protein TNCV_636331 [Trichonephila clavipes]|nr:uncharacterized protein TNCV_636331 [Trichonephila clavipes]
MQQLWLLKLEWHEKLPVPVAAEWASFVQSLPVLEKLKTPRFVLSENLESIILYGFSDASEKGFGAVTCVSAIKNNGDRHSHLLCSKSRVAPLKTLNIPSFIFRFLLNARSSKKKRVSGALSLKEINKAELWLLKLVQKAEFSNEKKPPESALWESGVKSFKTHLKRVAGNSKLTLEEFITLLAEIESVLNSRPLSPLSSDFDDFET